ncbi:DUF2254 family protein [Methanococcus maripaludis]|uniref:DUF2254 domain-containing protein n=1 Tax=Methanococcus maripaludis TaxID=39152 RepID=A0A2L1CAG1_METMI|nr:DUF2254 family protein [Methanococcus maripaludis]AVB76293.1 hypothetical protein MMJJ_08830 [Methanococcus maripaludis]
MDMFKVYSLFLIAMFLIVKYWRNKENIDPKIKPYIKYIKEQCPKLKKILGLSSLISFLIYFYLPVSADISSNNIENLFKTASSGISILGAFIVAFSVATINSTSNNYSTRILDLFMNKSFFKAYLFLIILSLGFSSIIGAFLPSTNLLSSFIVFFGLMVLVSNFIALFFYIDEIIKFMKPENTVKNVLDEIKFEDTKEYLSKIKLGFFGKNENHFSKYPLQYLDLLFRKTADSRDKEVFKYLLEETHKKFEDFESKLYVEYSKTNDLQTYVKLPCYFATFYYGLLKNPNINHNEDYTRDIIKNMHLISDIVKKRDINWSINDGIDVRQFLDKYRTIVYLSKKQIFEEFQRRRLLFIYREMILIAVNALKSPKFLETTFGSALSVEIEEILKGIIDSDLGKDYFLNVLFVLSQCNYDLFINKIHDTDDFFNFSSYLLFKKIKELYGSDGFDFNDHLVVENSVIYFLMEYLFSEKDNFSENLNYLLELYKLGDNDVTNPHNGVNFELDQIRKNKFLNIAGTHKKTQLTSEQYDKFLKLYDEFQKKTYEMRVNKKKEDEPDVIIITDQMYSFQLK